ncbi:uncharacterized protein LOC113521513 [Galleria mellonella]|uniref:Uncharacterized protein LOC113521513 n=1 Tax=Galleria mellonella TaxID=7137 RepID=A0A6J1X1F4_GALME|nr:uncharacterized protein LOC113521513 [Galleria mellonella]
MALPDLDVRSVLNVVEENFQKVGLKAYAIRMIYIGEHTLPKDEIIKQFRKTIQAVNASYCEINVRGLLLVYDSYFVHIIEGSEDTVHRHLRFLFKSETDWIEEMRRLDDEAAQAAIAAAEEAAAEGLTVMMEDEPHQRSERQMFRRLKILTVYHSIQTLIFEGWQAVTANPPSLIGKLDIFGPLAEHMEQLRICLDKINRLCQIAKSEETLSFEGLSAVDAKMEALPEVALLDYLLQSQYILDLRHVAHLHRRVDDYCFYFENVWPLPTQFTPRLLYKLKVDDLFVEPLPVMPWELVNKETTDDEEREEQSGSSSTD